MFGHDKDALTEARRPDSENPEGIPEFRKVFPRNKRKI
jgi:hypothetical protein